MPNNNFPSIPYSPLWLNLRNCKKCRIHCAVGRRRSRSRKCRPAPPPTDRLWSRARPPCRPRHRRCRLWSFPRCRSCSATALSRRSRNQHGPLKQSPRRAFSPFSKYFPRSVRNETHSRILWRGALRYNFRAANLD